MLRSTTIASAAAAIACLAAPGAAVSAAPDHETIITKSGSQTVALTDHPPCVGTAVIAYHDTFTIVDFGNGTLHLADAQAGTFTFVSSSDGKTYVGRYSGMFMHQSPPPDKGTPPGENFVEGGTFSLTGAAADGSRLRFLVLFHVTSTPDGDFATLIDGAHCITG
jgi:hypothetical protein